MRRTAWIRRFSSLRTLANDVRSGRTEIAQAEASLYSHLDSMSDLPFPSPALTADDAGDVAWCLCCACPPENEALSTRVSEILLRLHDLGRGVSFSPEHVKNVIMFLVQALNSCSSALTAHPITCAAICVVRNQPNTVDSHELDALIFALVSLWDTNTAKSELLCCTAVEGVANILSVSPKLLGHESLYAARDCVWRSFDCHWRKAVSCECIAEPYTTFQLVEMTRSHLRMVIAGARGLKFAIETASESWTRQHVEGLFIALNNIIQPNLPERSLIEDSCGNGNPRRTDLLHELIIECLGLLGILASKCSMILLPHWGLFLPTRLEGHILSPANRTQDMCEKSVIKPAGLVYLMRSSYPATVKVAATTVASEMVRGAPLKLIMKPPSNASVGRAPLSTMPRGISERLTPMITCLYETIVIAADEEKDPTVMASILKCGCSLAEGLFYLPMFNENGDRLSIINGSIDSLLMRFLAVASRLLLLWSKGKEEEYNPNSSSSSLKSCRSEASRLLATALSQTRPLAACNYFLSPMSTGHDNAQDDEVPPASGFVHTILCELTDVELSTRADLLYLISRIGRKYHWHLISHCNWPPLFVVLSKCFCNMDQNTRLHGLKVVEELLHGRVDVKLSRFSFCGCYENDGNSLVDSDPYSSWGEVLRNLLSYALLDPYHGVRSVAVSCHGLFLPKDWEMVGNEDFRVQRVNKLLNVLSDDANTGVSSNACHTIGMIVALESGDGWNINPSLIRTIICSLLAACRASRTAVSVKAMVALGQVVRAIFGKEGQREELIHPKDAHEVCGVAVDALERQGKSGPIAAQILGYMAVLEAQASPSWSVAADIVGVPASLLASTIANPGDNHDEKCLWNCCAALCKALGDSDSIQALEERGQLNPIFSGLCGIITSPCSPTFMNQGWRKARTYAAIALAIPSCHSLYSSSLLDVVTTAALAVADWDAGKRHMSSSPPNCSKDTKSYEAVHEALLNLAVHIAAVVALGGKQPTEDWWNSGQKQWAKVGESPMCSDILEALLEALSSATAVQTTLGSWASWTKPAWVAQLYEKVGACIHRGSNNKPRTAVSVHAACAAACCASLCESAKCFPAGNGVVERLKTCCQKWLQLSETGALEEL